MSGETIQPREHPPHRLRETLMKKMGFVEVLEAEKPVAAQIRWQAYEVRTALRLGEKGRFVYDPRNLLKPDLTEICVSDFTAGLTAVKNGNIPDLAALFPQADPVILRGILRRLTPKDLDHLTPENSGLAYQVLKRELADRVDADSSKPQVLVVSHDRVPDMGQIIAREVGKHIPSQKLVGLVRDLFATGFFASFTPYLGAATVMEQLEATGKVGKMDLWDYHVFENPETDKKLQNQAYKYAFLTGALSFDLPDLVKITRELKSKGIRVVIGGLGPTIDPGAVARATGADVFIGEIEQAADKLLDHLEKAQPDRQLIFHRETGISSAESDTNQSHVCLGLPRLANLVESYHPDTERSGRLSRRLYYERLMLPELHAFDTDWDPPNWLFKQIEFTRGCPWGCKFCSTAEVHGHIMRRKPLETLEMEIMASESKGLIAVDQNFTAQSVGEKNDSWQNWIQGIFSLLDRNNKRLCYQTEAKFFGKIKNHPDISGLVGHNTLAVLAGIEQPAPVADSAVKNPDHYQEDIGIARKLGILTLATIVVGLEDFPLSDWKKFLRDVNPTFLAAFPFLRVPGANGIPPTPDTADPLSGYGKKYQDPDLEKADRIAAEFYSLPNILRRLWEIRDHKLTRIVGALCINTGFHALYASGRDIHQLSKSVR